MAHKDSTRLAVRAAYINERLTLSAAAARHHIQRNTAATWKRQAKAGGDDWDLARNSLRLAKGGIAKITEVILEDFSYLASSTLAELKRNTSLNPLQKAEALVKLSDAYAKTTKAAGCVDPQLGRLSIAMDVIQDLGEFLQKDAPDLIDPFSNALHRYGAHLTAKWGRR